jgi:hypothetical protein
MRARPPSFVVAAAFGLIIASVSHAQTNSPTADAVEGQDSDPTRAILFSVRPEIYKPNDDVTQAALIFRYDRAMLVKRRWLPGRRGVIVRAELPMLRTQADDNAEAGIGDAYAQMLVTLYRKQSFAVVGGTGVIVPTATGDRLGSGKWVLAPAAGPVWFFRGHGMAFVKFQNFVSVAGDDRRPDSNFLLITPTIVRTFSGRWWMLADSEAKTDWTDDGHTSAKSGLQLGKAVGRRFAVWMKPEVWWGADRDGRWNMKFGLVWYR